MFKSQVNAKKIALKSAVDSKAEAYGDWNMIKMVVRNLVSNAIKFTSEGGEITIRANQSGDYQEISVSDTGTGIAEADIEKLFRIDVHYSNKGTNQEKGTGLGLILCREFVTKNGGRIWVESVEGQGSDFKFTLPGKPEMVGLQD
ncbi:MAG: HAMP domain-containing histidine kinase [Proteobacteria bacterium]|nr:HAMP domain-containing histidine kinase [Pseudomonadota bacterium]